MREQELKIFTVGLYGSQSVCLFADYVEIHHWLFTTHVTTDLYFFINGIKDSIAIIDLDIVRNLICERQILDLHNLPFVHKEHNLVEVEVAGYE